MRDIEKLYRYYDVQYSAGCDEYGGDLGPGPVKVHLMEFSIIKETRCGVWILTGYWFGTPEEKPPKEAMRFVNMQANKKYACRTKEEALESFKARKRRQIHILKSQTERAEKALLEADNVGSRQECTQTLL